MRISTSIACLILGQPVFAIETMSTGLSLPEALYSDYIDRVLPMEAVSEAKCILKFEYFLKPSAIGSGNKDVQIKMKVKQGGLEVDHVLSTSLMKEAFLKTLPQKWEVKNAQLQSAYRRRTCQYTLDRKPKSNQAFEELEYLKDKFYSILTAGTSYEVKPKRRPSSE
jgi:hypothetical protein